MTDETGSDREQRLNEVMAAYVQAFEAGHAPERDELVARHPDLAEDLRSFFADYEEFHRLAGSLRDAIRSANPEPIRGTGLLGDVITEGADPDDSDPTEHLNGLAQSRSVGDRIPYFGDYLLTGEIARGGMGVVYRARQISLNRTVALKMILAGTLASEADLQRFRNEAEAVANLDHPGIVPIYEVGIHEGQSYFSMKLIDGGSLAERLPDYIADPRAAARLLAAIARAVHHAHQRGLLHRDLKPSNILVDSQGHPHVTDFGLAKRVEGDSELTQSGAILGSPPYMAPEQTTGHRGAITTATDVYGLGAILYAILAGRPPFRADSVLETIEQVRKREPEPPSGINPRVSRDLQTVCLKCLEKDPKRRYASAQDLAEDLERWLTGWPILARRPGMLDHVAKWTRRNQALVAGLLGVLILSVLGLLLAVVFLDRERAETVHERDIARQRTIEARDATETLRKELYVSRIRQAHGEWLANNVAQTEAILQDCPVPLRGWEWNYCENICHLDLRTLHGHTMEVTSLAVNRDGTRVFSVGNVSGGGINEHGELGFWDVATGKMNSLDVHPRIQSVAYSPSEDLAAIGYNDGRITLMCPTTGRPVRELRISQDKAGIWCLAFSVDGRRLAAGFRDNLAGFLEIWDTETGRNSRAFPRSPGYPCSIAFHPNGKQLAEANEDGTLRLLDIEGVEKPRLLSGHLGPVYGVAFAPDGSQIASAGWDRTIRVWDPATKTEPSVRTLVGHTGFVHTVNFSPDGTLIASGGSDNTARLWDAATGQERALFRGHVDSVHAVAFARGGRMLVTGSDDHTIKFWDLEDDHRMRIMRHKDWVNSVTYSPDGKTIASAGSDGFIKLWDAHTGREIHAFPHQETRINGVAFSPDGRSLVTGDWHGRVRIWDLAEKTPVRTLALHKNWMVLAVAFSPDGSQVASSGLKDPVHLWDVASGREVRTFSAEAIGAYSLAFSPDGSRIAAAGIDQKIRIWEIGTGKLVVSIPCPGDSSTQKSGVLAFSPDGLRIAAATESGAGPIQTHNVKVWDASTGHEVLTLRGHNKQVNSVAFTPDSSRMATASNDGTVKLWETESGREVLTLRGHTGGVIALDFSPDGRHLASGSVDATLRIWDAPSAASAVAPTKVVRQPSSGDESRHQPN